MTVVGCMQAAVPSRSRLVLQPADPQDPLNLIACESDDIIFAGVQVCGHCNYMSPALGSFPAIRRRVLKLLLPSEDSAEICAASLQTLDILVSGRSSAADRPSEYRHKLLQLRIAHSILLFPGLPENTPEEEEDVVRFPPFAFFFPFILAGPPVKSPMGTVGDSNLLQATPFVACLPMSTWRCHTMGLSWCQMQQLRYCDKRICSLNLASSRFMYSAKSSCLVGSGKVRNC